MTRLNSCGNTDKTYLLTYILILVVFRLRAVPLFSYSLSRAERQKIGRTKVGRAKAGVKKGEKKGLQTKPQRLTYALLPQRKNAIG